jgi:hypothetical protein
MAPSVAPREATLIDRVSSLIITGISERTLTSLGNDAVDIYSDSNKVDKAFEVVNSPANQASRLGLLSWIHQKQLRTAGGDIDAYTHAKLEYKKNPPCHLSFHSRYRLYQEIIVIFVSSDAHTLGSILGY